MFSDFFFRKSIFKFFLWFLNLKNNFQNLFLFLITWTTTWQRLHSQQLPRELLACQVRHEVGPRTFFKQIFFYRDVFQIFFLQGQKSKLTQITGTIIIFKPILNSVSSFILFFYNHFWHCLWKLHLSCSGLECTGSDTQLCKF